MIDETKQLISKVLHARKIRYTISYVDGAIQVPQCIYDAEELIMRGNSRKGVYIIFGHIMDTLSEALAGREECFGVLESVVKFALDGGSKNLQLTCLTLCSKQWTKNRPIKYYNELLAKVQLLESEEPGISYGFESYTN